MVRRSHVPPSYALPGARLACTTSQMTMPAVLRLRLHSHALTLAWFPTPADVDYQSRNVLADPELREAIKKFSNWPTIPQVLENLHPLGASASCSVSRCGPEVLARTASNWKHRLLGRAVPDADCSRGLHVGAAQLYIKGEFVGGSDILMGLHRSGDLRTLLSDGPKEHTAA
jgi:glutaredoxin-related protein